VAVTIKICMQQLNHDHLSHGNQLTHIYNKKNLLKPEFSIKTTLIRHKLKTTKDIITQHEPKPNVEHRSVNEEKPVDAN
jgi:hypothetical protein